MIIVLRRQEARGQGNSLGHGGDSNVGDIKSEQMQESTDSE